MDVIKVYAIHESSDVPVKVLLEACPNLNVIGLTRSFALASQQVLIMNPDIVVYNPVTDGDEFSRIQKLASQCPMASLVVVSNSVDPDYVRKCLRSGAHDFLPAPIEPSALESELAMVYQRSLRRRKQETLSVLMDRFTNRPRIAGFLSGKGGVGKTTISVNTAVALVQMKKSVVLVDLDADLAGTELFLGITPKRTLSDLTDVPLDDVPLRLADILTWHDSGLAVLCAPKFTTSIGGLTVALIRVVLQSLQRDFQYVLVDLPPVLDTYTLAVLEMSQAAFMISTPNLSVLMTNQKMLDLFRRLDYDTTKITHVLNCVGARQGVRLTDCSRLLQGPVEYTLPYDFRRAEQAINKAQPLVLQRNSAFTKAFHKLAMGVTGSLRGASKVHASGGETGTT